MTFITRLILTIATILGLSRVAKKYLLSASNEYNIPEGLKKIITKIQIETNRIDEAITDAIEEGKKTFKMTEDELTQELENDTTSSKDHESTDNLDE
jgi:hypothetical protein